MEFAVSLPSEVIVIPRGWSFVGTTTAVGEGLEWTSEYAAVGVNGFGLLLLADGKMRLVCLLRFFYFVNYVGNQEEPDDKPAVLSTHELVTRILTTFSTVDDARESIGRVVVPAVRVPAFGSVPSLQYIVMDRPGDCIVLEHIDGELVVYDNPLGVITNSPSFDLAYHQPRQLRQPAPMNAPPF